MLSQIYEAEASAIKEIAEHGSCVIVGRCADKVLEKTTPCLRLFIHAGLPYRCKRVSELYGVKKENIEDYVKMVDKRRERFFKLFHDGAWDSSLNYDFCFNAEKISTERIIEVVSAAFSELGKEAAK